MAANTAKIATNNDKIASNKIDADCFKTLRDWNSSQTAAIQARVRAADAKVASYERAGIFSGVVYAKATQEKTDAGVEYSQNFAAIMKCDADIAATKSSTAMLENINSGLNAKNVNLQLQVDVFNKLIANAPKTGGA